MAKLVINADLGRHRISRHIYGHFAEHLGRCIYDGIWVGEGSKVPHTRGMRDDVVEVLRRIRLPVLRWPGGCFADEYHWQDGIGPRSERPAIINTHWGDVVEDNSFGTHEFLDLCGQIGCEPYICGNVGSGTVREMSQWAEYVNSKGTPMASRRTANGRPDPWNVSFWGVGNESWGCGGRMRPEYYANEYRRYGLYCRDYGDNRLYRIACGPNGDDYAWTEVLMREAAEYMHGLSLHYYTSERAPEVGRVGSATQFGEREWFAFLRKALVMEDLVTRHNSIMDRYDPDKRVALVVDEWGTWYKVEPGTNPRFLYQQNTVRDALVAGLTLNVFNNHAERVRMANLAQTVNVLQALVLTEENGGPMAVTPTCHVFDMYQVHQDATLLPVDLRCEEYRLGEQAIPQLSASASRDGTGRVHVSLCNTNPTEAVEIRCEMRGFTPGSVSGTVLTGPNMNSHNTFDAPEAVRPKALDGLKLHQSVATVPLPPMSVAVLEITV